MDYSPHSPEQDEDASLAKRLQEQEYFGGEEQQSTQGASKTTTVTCLCPPAWRQQPGALRLFFVSQAADRLLLRII